MAVILKASTLLRFHHALVKRKYSLLYGPRARHRPGPKGPSKELIGAVIEMKRRNPRFGCRKIAEQISRAFAVQINKMSSDEYSSATTDLPRAEMDLRSSASSGTLRTACGASISFAANRFCSRATGS
jgi:hypothetical protein